MAAVKAPGARYRLHVEAALAGGAEMPLEREQANYLLNVLRMREGDAVLLFNGRDGEWRAELRPDGRKSARLRVVERVREQTPRPDLLYLFAPLKSARLDYLVQKAVEMGAGTLAPVITKRTQIHKLNADRMRANIVEAAEQCGILAIPDLLPERPLAAALDALEPERLLVFCDEEALSDSPLAALSEAPPGPTALLIGPEGGFDDAERALVANRTRMLRISLGPRILRADTAAVAALALVQSLRGDWPRGQPEQPDP